MDNPSATPTVRHLPLHRGGVNSEKAKRTVVKRSDNDRGIVYNRFTGVLNRQYCIKLQSMQ